MSVRVLAFLMAIFINSGCVIQHKELEEMRYELQIESVEREDEIIEILLDLWCNSGICGVSVDVYYDSDSFLLLSCGVENVDDLNFSYLNGAGAVRILLDGVDNHPSEKIRVTFYFAGIDGVVKGGVFEARGIDAYQVSGNGQVLEIEAGEGASCVVPGKEQYDDLERRVEVVGIDVDGHELVLLGRVSDGFFAAGFKVFTVDLQSGKNESFYVAGVVKSSTEFERRVTVNIEGAMVIVVTPIAFERNVIVQGCVKLQFFSETNASLPPRWKPLCSPRRTHRQIKN